MKSLGRMLTLSAVFITTMAPSSCNVTNTARYWIFSKAETPMYNDSTTISFFGSGSNRIVLYSTIFNSSGQTPPSGWTVIWFKKYNNYYPDSQDTGAVSTNGFLADATNGNVNVGNSVGAGNAQIVAYDTERWQLTPTWEWSATGNVSSGNMAGKWSAGTTYNVNDIAQDTIDSNEYIALSSTTGVQPSTDGGVHWQLLLPDTTTMVNTAIAFANLAHSKGFKAMYVPASDIWQSEVPGTYSESHMGMIASGIMGQVAPYYDFIDLQVQGIQRFTSTPTNGDVTYQNTVYQIAQQAYAANPKIIIMAGLQTKNNDYTDSVKAATTDSNQLNGEWLNLNGTDSGNTNDWISTLQNLPAGV